MEKYINQIVVIDTILGNPPDAHYPVWFAEQIGNLPAADVVEVVHGEWKVNVGMNYNEERICCRCQKRIKGNHWNYCPNCGAKMDGRHT